MKLWKTGITLNGIALGCVDIRKGIDGMVVSHFLYLDDLKLHSKSEEDIYASIGKHSKDFF